jgi:hypothetical protein
MTTNFAIYKGLQKPLVYRGFKGKFIAWGIGSLVTGLVSGGVLGAITNMFLGAFITIVFIAGGLFYTFSRQQHGLHTKTRSRKTYIQPTHLKKSYASSFKNSF